MADDARLEATLAVLKARRDAGKMDDETYQKMTLEAHAALVRGMMQPTTTVTPTIDAAAKLAEHFETIDTRRQQPWRSAQEAANVSIKTIERGGSLDDRRIWYIDMAKNCLVFPEDAIAACYRLFGDDDAHQFYDGMLIHTEPGAKRVATHNWYVARRIGPLFTDEYGAIIATLPCPLFGWDPTLMSLNQKVIALAKDAPAGAGEGGASGPMKAFRQHPTGGAYLAPVQTAPNGQTYVDLGPADDALRDFRTRHDADVAALGAELADLRRQLRNGSRHREGNSYGTGNSYGNRGRGSGGGPRRGGSSARQAPRGGQAPADGTTAQQAGF